MLYTIFNVHISVIQICEIGKKSSKTFYALCGLYVAAGVESGQRITAFLPRQLFYTVNMHLGFYKTHKNRVRVDTWLPCCWYEMVLLRMSNPGGNHGLFFLFSLQTIYRINITRLFMATRKWSVFFLPRHDGAWALQESSGVYFFVLRQRAKINK